MSIIFSMAGTILHHPCCCSRGEKIDTFSYAFEGEMIALLHNKSGFPEGVSSYANVQRQFFESFVGQTFKVAYPPINFLLFSVLRIRDVYPGSRIQDVYPGSRIQVFTHPRSRISDPGSKNINKREGRKKISRSTFFCSHNFKKLKII
jgi:hypothetical protein